MAKFKGSGETKEGTRPNHFARRAFLPPQFRSKSKTPPVLLFLLFALLDSSLLHTSSSLQPMVHYNRVPIYAFPICRTPLPSRFHIQHGSKPFSIPRFSPTFPFATLHYIATEATHTDTYLCLASVAQHHPFPALGPPTASPTWNSNRRVTRRDRLSMRRSPRVSQSAQSET